MAVFMPDCERFECVSQVSRACCGLGFMRVCWSVEVTLQQVIFLIITWQELLHTFFKYPCFFVNVLYMCVFVCACMLHPPSHVGGYAGPERRVLLKEEVGVF